MLKIVLYAPRIPQNTGQIARACRAMRCELHLVRPLGFRIDAAALRRSSVGYLEQMNFIIHSDGEALWQAIAEDEGRAWLVTKFGAAGYHQIVYRAGDWLIFGNEDEGLPPAWLESHRERTLRIPMADPAVRCLNLATSAGVVMFEALRQIGFVDTRIRSND